MQSHIEESDLVSIQAPGYKDAYTLMTFYKAQNKKVVVDYDDYSFDLDPGNPRYAELGTKECDVLGPKGETVFSWKDGQNGFDLKSNIAKYEAFKKCVESADLVTTTTEYLANKFRAINPNVAICPNSVDFNIWKKVSRAKDHDQIRIGWFGGDSHFTDLKVFKTLFPRLCKEYPNVKIVIQAPPMPEWVEFFKDIPSNQLEWHGWADLRYYTLFLASRDIDIGLCPLENTDFNRCKSSIKFLEFSALGAATVAQNMLPYAETIFNGKHGLLADKEDDWFACIAELIENEDLRKQLAENAFNLTFSNYNLDKNCRLWEQAYLRCLEG